MTSQPNATSTGVLLSSAMLVASPYAIFRADQNLHVQSAQSANAAAVQRRVTKTLAPIQPPAAWATLIQGDLFDALPPL